MNPEVKSTLKAQNWKLTLAYDGAEFRGWQVQPGERTVQGELQSALHRVTGEAPLPQGSGRTDAGVHALAQVASFPLHAPIPAGNLLLALNRTLPASIRVLEARPVRSAFHARHSAQGKTYEYRIFLEKPAPWLDPRAPGRICSPFLAPYVCLYPWPLEIEPMQQAAQAFLGEHDFLSFAASDPDLAARTLSSVAPSALRPLPRPDFDPQPPASLSIRTIYSSQWEERATEFGEILVYRVSGSGFLHHMVRNLVGTMLDVGRGQLRAEAMAAILAARLRSAAGPTAPPQGLFLHSVKYNASDEALENISEQGQ
jgi:tRNA pseudouridine38-40 synthase